MKEYNKLVRDKIPEIIKNSGRKCDIHIAHSKEALSLLEKKLDEEVLEFHTDKNLEELADIMEVIFSLSKNSGYSEKDLLDKCYHKRSERGGFDENIILEKVYD